MGLGLYLLASAVGEVAWAVDGVLNGHRTWQGVVRVEEDTRVLPGSTLTVLPGTRVVFAAAESTKTDPFYWSSGTELAVAGRLEVRGTRDAPVIFEGEGAWGGLVIAPGGEAVMHGAVVRGADEGILCVDAACGLTDVRIEGGDYGVVVGPGARFVAERVLVTGARVGVLDTRGSDSPLKGVSVQAAVDVARLSAPVSRLAVAGVGTRDGNRKGARARVEYVGDYTVETDETWREEVILAGRVTVIPGAVLTLLPDTRVRFRKLDSNGDELGEAELLVLGGIRSLGEPGRPVVFESAEASPVPGDWDKVSLIASEDPDNRFRHTVFRYGTQALHAHFSSFVAEACYFERNLRAVQFQESDAARVTASVFVRNKQAMRFRDSRVAVVGSVLFENLYGVHAFRCELEFVGNTLVGNALGGVLAKESGVTFVGNRVLANRDGVRMKDMGSRALIRGNRFSESAEDALSLNQVEAIVEANLFEGAGLDLASTQDSPVVFRGNVFGIAGRDALHLKGAVDVDARQNYWGAIAVPQRIHDREDDAALGSAEWFPALPASPRLSLPREAW